MITAPVLVSLTAQGLILCRRLQPLWPDAEVHGLSGRAEGADTSFADVTAHLRTLFAEGRAIIGVCAAGVLIRAVAPEIMDKHVDPPVVAVSEDGKIIVPLLGGHHGAIRLAQEIAATTGGTAAITTAGDVRFGVGLDDPPAGWTLGNPEDYKGFVAALLDGEAVRLEGYSPWLLESSLPFSESAAKVLRVDERTDGYSPSCLVYHPRILAVGVGAERGADPAATVAFVRSVLAKNLLSEAAVAGVYSLDLKMDEAAVHAVGKALGVPVRFFDATTLEALTPRLSSPSETVFSQVGCHGVAEAAALAAADLAGVEPSALVVPKDKVSYATCAIARAPVPFDGGAVGCKRGRLAVVGLGPGTLDWRTPEASRWLAEAEDIVGYGFYNDLAGPLAAGVRRHDFPLGKEERRARAALDLAAEGRTVVLVSSGDPGIYAMATLVFELLDKAPDPAWRGVEISVVPGISAFQAAAARIGAPMAHDLCLISLSDLLTPWEVILKRVEAAAEADFLIAFYNPVSIKRRHQLEESVAALLRSRSPETPVVVARQLGREDERIEVIRLGDLTPDHADMLTLILVGNSETRRIERPGGGQWVYTPRGYSGKKTSSMKGA